MTLDMARVGDSLRVTRIADMDTAMVALRLGIAEGEALDLAAKVPGGPVVVRRGGMEIALGRDISRHIEVAPHGR